MSSAGLYLWLLIFAFLIIILLVILVVKRYGLDWRSYLAIAAAFLLVVARRDDINQLVTLPSAFYTTCLVLGILFLLLGFGSLTVGLFRRPQPQPPQRGGSRPEVSYASRRSEAARSWHSRVSLVLTPPPLTGPSGMASLLAGLGGPEERNVFGRHISALYSYEVLIQNTGDQPFRDLPITIDLLWPGRAFAPAGRDAEYLIEEPTITPPPGARVLELRHQEDPVTLSFTCDLLNPKEQLEVRFYTRGPAFQSYRDEPQPRVVARAEHLPPAVPCNWPDGDEPLRPPEPEYDVESRGRIRSAVGRQLIRLGRALSRAGNKVGYRRVPRRRGHD